MIKTKCRWCKRDINVNWEPLSNWFLLQSSQGLCVHCLLGYEAGWFFRRVRMYLEKKAVTQKAG
jgi:hypothetical protein